MQDSSHGPGAASSRSEALNSQERSFPDIKFRQGKKKYCAFYGMASALHFAGYTDQAAKLRIVPPNWKCIVPEDIQFPAGTKPRSAEVKFMTLSNCKGNSDKTRWGGSATWTTKEMEAINAQRDDGDNINTIIACAMDPLTGDIRVYVHDIDLELYGKYVLSDGSFYAVDEQASTPIPPRHRSTHQLQLWLDQIEAQLISPPAVIIHLHPKGKQDAHYSLPPPLRKRDVKKLRQAKVPWGSKKTAHG